jgi:hypothetical protein
VAKEIAQYNPRKCPKIWENGATRATFRILAKYQSKRPMIRRKQINIYPFQRMSNK